MAMMGWESEGEFGRASEMPGSNSKEWLLRRGKPCPEQEAQQAESGGQKPAWRP
jgi:hypothetical protein